MLICKIFLSDGFVIRNRIVIFNSMEEVLEIWKPVVGYEGLYEVSNLGRVKSLDRIVKGCYGSIAHKKGKIISSGIGSTGYCIVSLQKDGKGKSFGVHRLVAQAFIPNPDNLPMVNHKDEVKTNNNVENLEWCDCKYNCNYGTGIERCVNTKVERGLVDEEHIGSTKKGKYKTLRNEILNKQKLYYQEHRQERIEYQKKYNSIYRQKQSE